MESSKGTFRKRRCAFEKVETSTCPSFGVLGSGLSNPQYLQTRDNDNSPQNSPDMPL